MIYSRHPLDRRELPADPRLDFDAVAGRVTVPGAPPLVVLAAHPVPPWPNDTERWHDELAILRHWLDRLPATTPVVVAGELNGSTDHPAVRYLMADRLVDAHRAAGAGRPLTWPHEASLPPLVQLDHVLVEGPEPVAAAAVAFRAATTTWCGPDWPGRQVTEGRRTHWPIPAEGSTMSGRTLERGREARSWHDASWPRC